MRKYIDKGWDSLSYKDKAEMMRVAVANGLTNLSDIRERFNKFAEGGDTDSSDNSDAAYYDYMEKLATKKAKDWHQTPEETLIQMMNDNEYNYRSFWDYDRANALKMLTADPEAHFTDIGKTVYHPTFSDESMYSNRVSDYNPRGTIGGHWQDFGGNEYYIPSSSQFMNRDINLDRTRSYLREADPSVRLNLMNMPWYKYTEGENLFAKGGKTNAKKASSNTSNLDTARYAMKYLMDRGISKAGASAIVGTLQAESGLIPGIHAQMKGDNGEGLAQWTGSRKKVFWDTLEKIEPGAKKKYGSVVNVPFERQLDVVLHERPDVIDAISGAKDVQTATDLMLRGYENGGGTINNIASVADINRIYGKWNNGYTKQYNKRLGNANTLFTAGISPTVTNGTKDSALGLTIAPSNYEIPETFFSNFNQQINAIPVQQSRRMLDPHLESQPLSTVLPIQEYPSQREKPLEGTSEDPVAERNERWQQLGNVLGLVGVSNPLMGLVGETGKNNGFGLMNLMRMIGQ